MNDMKSKLGIDFNQVEHARDVARKIANGVQDFVEGYTTVAVERTLCRLIGIDGVDANAVPLPNVVVEELREKNVLGEGALFFLGNAIVETGLTPQQIAEQIAAGKLDITRSAVCTRSGAETVYRRQHRQNRSQPPASRKLHRHHRRRAAPLPLRNRSDG